MTSWVRNHENNRLFRSEPDLEIELTPESEPKPRIEEMAQERSLSDIFCPSRTTLPSCFTILNLGPNVTFELGPHYTQILPKIYWFRGCLFIFGGIRISLFYDAFF